MKKQLFLTAVAALAMVSCSEENVLDTNRGNAIDFRAAMGTRAQETTTANMSSIYVTALNAREENLFSDQLFSKQPDNFFTSTPVYHWPGDGSTLTFYAYSPSKTDLGGTLEITSTTKKLTDFSPKASITDQKDFVTIKTTGNKTNNEATGVPLQFEHRLVQIEVQAKNANEGYVYKVKGVRIGKPVSKGTFDFETNAWVLNTEKTNYEAECDNEQILAAQPVSIMKANDDNAMLIPQSLTAWATTDKTNVAEGAYLAVKVQITTKAGARVYPVANGVDYDWVAVPIGTNWVAGKKFIYTLDFSNGAGKVDPEKEIDPSDTEDHYQPGDDILGGPIKFTVNVTGWTGQTENIGM